MTNTKKIEQTIAKTLNESSKTIDGISNLSNNSEQNINQNDFMFQKLM